MTKTNKLFWDCNCDTEYIHPKLDISCPKCKANYQEAPQDYPDSKNNEIKDERNHFNRTHFKDMAVRIHKEFKRARELTLKYGASVLFLDELMTDDQKEIKRLTSKINNMEEVLTHRAEDIIQRTKTNIRLKELLLNLARRHEWGQYAGGRLCQCPWHIEARQLQ